MGRCPAARPFVAVESLATQVVQGRLTRNFLLMYDPNRLEWHPGEESRLRTPQFAVVGLDKHQARLLPTFNRLVAAHAKSQDPPERIEGFLLLQTVLRTK